MLFYTSTPLENKSDKNTGSMCKTKMQKARDGKVTNRTGRAFIQKILTPFKPSIRESKPALNKLEPKEKL